jgi:hypothetical protein
VYVGWPERGRGRKFVFTPADKRNPGREREEEGEREREEKGERERERARART